MLYLFSSVTDLCELCRGTSNRTGFLFRNSEKPHFGQIAVGCDHRVKIKRVFVSAVVFYTVGAVMRLPMLCSKQDIPSYVSFRRQCTHYGKSVFFLLNTGQQVFVYCENEAREQAQERTPRSVTSTVVYLQSQLKFRNSATSFSSNVGRKSSGLVSIESYPRTVFNRGVC